MAPTMKAYSPLNVIVLVDGVEIVGYAEGDDAISVKRLADSATHKVGCQGDVLVSLSADRTGEVTLKLQGTSSSNSFLEGKLALQENGADTFQPIAVLFQDTYRNDLGQASQGYIKRPADFKRGQNMGDQEWVLIVSNLVLEYGN